MEKPYVHSSFLTRSQIETTLSVDESISQIGFLSGGHAGKNKDMGAVVNHKNDKCDKATIESRSVNPAFNRLHLQCCFDRSSF